MVSGTASPMPDSRGGKRQGRQDGGLSSNQCFAIERNLERAKGLEPSTPTLARSCSTTELHPHPLLAAIARRQRRTYAKCAPRLQQPHTVRIEPDKLIFLTNGHESAGNNAAGAGYRPEGAWGVI